MTDADSPHGLRLGRRGGYQREQVDAHLTRLIEDRDGRWSQVSELEERVAESERRLAAVRRQAEEIVPEYDALGTRAQRILGLVEEQATALRQEAEQGAEDDDAAARRDADTVLSTAEKEMAAYRAAADQQADNIVDLARKEGEGIVNDAESRAKSELDAARGEVERAREETARTVADFEAQLARRSEQEDAAEKKKRRDLDARLDGLTARAEDVLDRADRDRAAAEEEARKLDETSTAEAERLSAEARSKVEAIRSRSERDQREHLRKVEAITAHLDHIKQMLATLTGAAAATEPAAGADDPTIAVDPSGAEPSAEDPTMVIDRGKLQG